MITDYILLSVLAVLIAIAFGVIIYAIKSERAAKAAETRTSPAPKTETTRQRDWATVQREILHILKREKKRITKWGLMNIFIDLYCKNTSFFVTRPEKRRFWKKYHYQKTTIH